MLLHWSSRTHLEDSRSRCEQIIIISVIFLLLKTRHHLFMALNQVKYFGKKSQEPWGNSNRFIRAQDQVIYHEPNGSKFLVIWEIRCMQSLCCHYCLHLLLVFKAKIASSLLHSSVSLQVLEASLPGELEQKEQNQRVLGGNPTSWRKRWWINQDTERTSSVCRCLACPAERISKVNFWQLPNVMCWRSSKCKKIVDIFCLPSLNS